MPYLYITTFDVHGQKVKSPGLAFTKLIWRSLMTLDTKVQLYKAYSLAVWIGHLGHKFHNKTVEMTS